MKKTFFITGTDTNVGKTVLTTLLVKFLRKQNANAIALKPICSGERVDALKIFAAMNGAMSLDEINPWYFRAPIAPLLAARAERKTIKLPQVLAQIRATRSRFDILLVEGAGGLLSPLGANFNSRDLILALRASPIIVAQNKIGAVNQVLLTLGALPKELQAKTKIVLMSPSKPDVSVKTNAKLFAKFFDAKRIFELPYFGKNFAAIRVLKNPHVRQIFRALAN